MLKSIFRPSTFLLIIVLWMNGIIFCYSQTSTQSHILKTVKLERADLVLSEPIILMGSNDQLVLQFDDLTGGVKRYSYTFVHCNQKWDVSKLSYFDFLNGFERNEIDNYSFSSATTQNYTHYSLTFPNNDISFKISGNYLIQVWDENNDTAPIISKRFYVWENIAAINSKVQRPNVIKYRNEFQRINTTVDITNAKISNPYDEIRLSIKMNKSDSITYTDIKPKLITRNILYYDDDNIVFPGGKEFRRFDTRSLRFKTDRISKVENSKTRNDSYITPDESRAYQQYIYETDMNGNFVIMADLTRNVEIEADYSYIHFVLQYPYFLTNGNMYVVGGFNGYACNNENKMEYNFDKQQYEATIYLKQGYYNYMYAFLDSKNPKLDFSYTEGNYFETENDFTIFVYEHVYDRDYDRLIGVKSVNSVKTK